MVVMRMVFRAANAVNSATIINHISAVRNVGTIRLLHSTPCNLAGKLGNLFTNIFQNLFFFEDRFYTDKHEWVEVNGKVGTIGISQYAQVNCVIKKKIKVNCSSFFLQQEALGDVVYAQLPDPETLFKQKGNHFYFTFLYTDFPIYR